MHERLDLQRVDPTYHLVFDDGRQLALKKALFELYFGDAQSPADHAVLLRAAQMAGLDKAQARAVLQGDKFADAVRAQELGSQCRVTSYALLKLIGLTDTGKNRVTLHTRITRLVANALEVKHGRYSYMGSLIAGAAKDEETQEWVIELNPKLRPLFAADQFTQVEWGVRHALSGKPMAQWLHGFYASHAKPFPIKVETLHQLCGSEAKRMSDYKIDLRKNLDAVAEACTAHGEGFSYEIRGDLVHVEKKAQGTQRRHLAKKASQPQKPRG